MMLNMPVPLALLILWLTAVGAANAVTLLIIDASKYYVGVASSAIFWLIGMSTSIYRLSGVLTKPATPPAAMFRMQ